MGVEGRGRKKGAASPETRIPRARTENDESGNRTGQVRQKSGASQERNRSSLASVVARRSSQLSLVASLGRRSSLASVAVRRSPRAPLVACSVVARRSSRSSLVARSVVARFSPRSSLVARLGRRSSLALVRCSPLGIGRLPALSAFAPRTSLLSRLAPRFSLLLGGNSLFLPAPGSFPTSCQFTFLTHRVPSWLVGRPLLS